MGLRRIEPELAGFAPALVIHVDHHVIHGVLVEHAFLVRTEAYAEHAHLIVFQFQFVMLGIHLQRFDVRRLVRLWLTHELDLDDPYRMVGNVLADVLPTGRTPSHVTGLVLDAVDLAVGPGERGHTVVEVDLDPAVGMLVHRAAAVRLLGCEDHPHLFGLDARGQRSGLRLFLRLSPKQHGDQGTPTDCQPSHERFHTHATYHSRGIPASD